MLEQEVGEAACAIGEFDVGAAERLAIGGYVVDGGCGWFDGGGAGEERCWGQGVEVGGYGGGDCGVRGCGDGEVGQEVR